MFRSTRFRIRNWRGFLETTMRVGALLRGLLYFIVWKPCKMFIYVCMYACVYVQYIYVSQGDFRLMCFTAGRCGTPLILNDQLRSNGVRSSNLIVCVSHVTSVCRATTNRTHEAAGVGPNGHYKPNRTGRSVRLWSWTTSSVVYEGMEWGPQIWFCALT